MKSGGLCRRGFVEVTYRERRCLCLLDYGMLHADHTDITSIYTVTAERYSFPEWPALPDLCSAVFQGELERIPLMFCITRVKFFFKFCVLNY